MLAKRGGMSGTGFLSCYGDGDVSPSASYALSRDMWMLKVTPQFEPRQPSSRVVREITCPLSISFR